MLVSVSGSVTIDSSYWYSGALPTFVVVSEFNNHPVATHMFSPAKRWTKTHDLQGVLHIPGGWPWDF